MALRQLLTDPTKLTAFKKADGELNARSIPFGNDRPEGGSSKQPFIQKKLPKVESAPTTQWPDFLLRDPKNVYNGRKDDLVRITKFLSSTEGVLFIAKQELLSLQNPITPGRPNRSNPAAGLYNPSMTLGQVAVAGTGIHIEKQGLIPIFNNREKYETVYKTEHSAENSNRLTLLYKAKINGFQPGDNQVEALREGYKLGLVPRPGATFNPQFLMSYLGGPGNNQIGRTTLLFAGNRVYGGNIETKTTASLQTSLNKTRLAISSDALIERITKKGVSQKSTELKYIPIDTGNTGTQYEYNDTRFLVNGNSVYTLGNTFPEVNTKNTLDKGVFTFNQKQLAGKTAIGRLGSTSLTGIQDFRAGVLDRTQNPVTEGQKIQQEQIGLFSYNYTSNTINREQRIGLGNPGKRTRNRGKLTAYDNETVDKLNMVPLYYDDIVLDPYGITRDLVKFRFEVVDNTNPAFSTFIHFRAFLGAINDNFSAAWEPTKYIGRGESFYNYGGFSRDIKFNFKVHAQSRAEMKTMYQKLNYLATSLAPDYKNGYMKGNLIRLTIGDYLYTVPGFITSLSYTIPEEGGWEIGLTQPEGGEDTGVLETPIYLEVSVAFTPIHDFVPQLSADRANALITPSRGVNPYLDGKIYNFENSFDPSTNKFTSTGKDAINTNNLKQFATTGSI